MIDDWSTECGGLFHSSGGFNLKVPFRNRITEDFSVSFIGVFPLKISAPTNSEYDRWAYQ